MPIYPREPSIVPNSAGISERLIAHARLCRQIAEQSWSEEAARELDVLANECMRAAAALATTRAAKPN